MSLARFLSRRRFTLVGMVLILAVGDAAFGAPRATGTSLAQLRQTIEKEKPLEFAFMRTPDLWSRDANYDFFSGEFHRLFIRYQPEKSSLEGAILARLNDPQNKRFLLLRRYMTYVRRQYLKAKPTDDPYARIKPEDPVFILHSNLFNESGPMTHINIANLILPESWAEKVYHTASPADGQVVYAYIALADSPEREVQELWNDRALFDHFLTHLSLRLMEAEARGQRWGLEAHMGAHTGPTVNLAFGTTWCQNRGFYEGWPLAQRALLTELFPDAFPAPKLEHLRNKDRFLYFSTDPWQETFEPLHADRLTWNTPQAVLSSNYVNAAIQFQLWHEPEIEEPIQKSIEILARYGSPTLHALLLDWAKAYPEDAPLLGKTLRRLTHDLTLASAAAQPTKMEEYFSCLGPDIWIGIPPPFDHVDFNASGPEEMKRMFSRLAYTMNYRDFQTWIFGPGGEKSASPQDLIALLADEMYAERAKRCGQFANFNEIKNFISAFGEQHKLSRKSVVSMIRVLDQGKVDLEVFYAAEKARLRGLGAYRAERAAISRLPSAPGNAVSQK